MVDEEISFSNIEKVKSGLKCMFFIKMKEIW